MAANDHLGSLDFLRRDAEAYTPRLQFLLRTLLAALTAVYFFWQAPHQTVLHELISSLLFVAYFTFHLLAWESAKKRAFGPIGVRTCCLVDMAAAGLATATDSSAVPPVLLLIFIAVFGNGLQHGRRVFMELILVGVPLIATVLVARDVVHGMWPTYGLIFLILFLVVSLYYSYMVIVRIEALKNEAVQASERDPLTGMRNRRAFGRGSRYLLALGQKTGLPLAVMFADIDKFKHVNDVLGHDMGDRVLSELGRICNNGVRGLDLAARYGGDEFAFLMLNCTPEDAVATAERLRGKFGEWTRDHGVDIGLSFGVSALPEGDADLAAALQRADAALYKAKSEGLGVSVAPSA
ncbi:MAG: diguanylate cyclase [Lentisphaerae bacterium]|nr:diguanylate cyclase [Lentisphaerota bacterium]